MNDSSSILLDGRSDCVEAVKALVLGCTRQLHLVTQRLEAELYNHAEIFDHLTALASANRNTEIRIIAQDTRVAANQGHYLIHLAQNYLAMYRSALRSPRRIAISGKAG